MHLVFKQIIFLFPTTMSTIFKSTQHRNLPTIVLQLDKKQLAESHVERDFGTMAFYDYCTPYNSASYYDFPSTPIQISFPYEYVEPELNYSPHTYSEPEILHYEPIDYQSSYNYYEYSINEPKLLQHEPLSNYARVYVPSETKFTISYSTSEFNEPEFEEYDSTPYGGGYDPVTTYGKPIPPSDITCYPRSVPKSDSISLENFTYASIPSPYGKDEDLPNKPSNRNEQVNAKADNAKHRDEAASEPVDTKDDNIGNGDKASSDDEDGEVDDESEREIENGTRGDYGYESERIGGVTSQIPYAYGSGLESMDICESLFGYWPCLAKRAQQEKIKCRFCEQERVDPWKGAADYLFGSPLVYDYENYHHQQQSQYQF